MEDSGIVDDNGRRIVPPKITTHRCQVTYSTGDDVYYICDESYPKMNLLSIVFNCSSAKCKVCLDLSWDCFPFAFFRRDSHSHDILPVENITRRIRTTVPIIESSQASCLSCKVLFLALKRCSQWYLRRGQGPVETSDFDVRITLSPEFTIKVYASNIRGDYLDLFELFTKPGQPSPWKSIGPASHRTIDPPTIDSSVKFIEKHLRMCRSHPTCRQKIPELPARIIDVHQLAKPRLVSTHGQHARYLTLSHCWGSGGYNPLVTRKVSLEEHHAAIPWNSLSLTFQHAILITWKLGYHYLWIDSLCIVQDDPLDWDIESGKMAEIYMNSEVTLSATSSEDGRGGCIVGRPDHPGEAPLILEDGLEHEYRSELKNIFMRVPAIQSHEIVDVLPASMIDVEKDSRQEMAPLTKRAWCFQETVLPRRNLIFHAEELIWECRWHLNCECGHLQWLWAKRVEMRRCSPSIIRNFPNPGWKSPFVALDIPWETEKDLIVIHWYKNVLAYSALQITYESDRLPALAGLASTFALKLESTYLAGLWECDLWRGLLWMRPESFGRSTRCRRLTGDASSIPTWSWASIIRDGHENAPIYDFASREFLGLQKDDRFSVISAKCSLSSTNMFGHVSGGVLRLRGALIQTLLSSENLGLSLKDYELLLIKPDLSGPTEYYPAYSGDLLHYLVFDVGFSGIPVEVRDSRPVYCLCVAGNEEPIDSEGTCMKFKICLVLKELRENTFMRVGILRYVFFVKDGKTRNWNFDSDPDVPHRDWFEDAPIVEVNIV